MSKGVLMYEQPRKGLFSRHGKWIKGEGWASIPTESLIIGEDEISYVYEIRKTEAGEIALGWHKSRLIKWEATQLSIF